MYFTCFTWIFFLALKQNLFELDQNLSVLCAMIYRPPKHNKNSLKDFSDLLAQIVPKYDRLLIDGDFTIHVCFPEKPLVKEFLNVIDSFNLPQFVSGPINEQGHTLDLVLFYGLFVFILMVCEPVFPDHSPIFFDISLLCKPVTLCAATQHFN